MKKLQLFTVALFSAASFFASAQSDIKINITNAFIYEFNINYEYLLNDYATIGAFGGAVYGLPGVEDPNKYWYLGPEFRYYVNPKNGADQFFIGIYSRFKSGSSYVDFYESGYDLNMQDYLSYYQSAQTDYTKLAIGLTCGGKWIAQNGFVYGIFGGIGRNLIANYDETQFVDHSAEFAPGYYSRNTDSYNDSRYWDFRIGFNVGWRLGK